MDSRFYSTSLTCPQVKHWNTLIQRSCNSTLSQTIPVQVIHDFSRFRLGQDYAFEPIDGSNRGYMRAYGGEIRRGDRLILDNGIEPIHYCVEEIEQYHDPANLWIALLRPCHRKTSDRRFWMGPATNLR